MKYRFTEDQHRRAMASLESLNAAQNKRRQWFEELTEALKPRFDGERGAACPDYEEVALVAPVVSEMSKALHARRIECKRALDKIADEATEEEKAWFVSFDI
jgi:hypothetical protein